METATPGWERGDVVQFVLDFNERQIHILKNDQHMATLEMQSHVKDLWPVVVLWASGHRVHILPSNVPPLSNLNKVASLENFLVRTFHKGAFS